MSAPDICGQRNPSVTGPRCTRPAGHLDAARDIYWQAAEQLAVTAAEGQEQS